METICVTLSFSLKVTRGVYKNLSQLFSQKVEVVSLIFNFFLIWPKNLKHLKIEY